MWVETASFLWQNWKIDLLSIVGHFEQRKQRKYCLEEFLLDSNKFARYFNARNNIKNLFENIFYFLGVILKTLLENCKTKRKKLVCKCCNNLD